VLGVGPPILEGDFSSSHDAHGLFLSEPCHPLLSSSGTLRLPCAGVVTTALQLSFLSHDVSSLMGLGPYLLN
jgi:hypothetical protein